MNELVLKKLDTGSFTAKTAITDLVLVTDPASDTGIVVTNSGKEYWYGTTTGAPGQTDAANACTFQLPTPTGAGEKVTINFSNAAVFAKINGISVAAPATVNMTYIASEDGTSVEVASTATGVDGTANTMIKIAASHVLIGDRIECISTSATNWLVQVRCEGGLMAAGDIAVDPGNVLGYID